jgi:hypothetical protein
MKYTKYIIIKKKAAKIIIKISDKISHIARFKKFLASKYREEKQLKL